MMNKTDIAKSIVQIENGKIYLDSGLDQDAFGKTNLMLELEEKGKTAVINGDTVDFEDFAFEQTEYLKSDAAGSSSQEVYFSSDFIDFENSENSENAKTLFDIFNDDSVSDDEKKSAVLKVCQVLTFAAENHEKSGLKVCGAGGIIISGNRITFLPAELFDRCAGQFTFKNKSENSQNKYLYKGLNDEDQILFLRSVIAYKALTGRLPFDEDDLTKRQSDIFDEKFIPLKLYRPEIKDSEKFFTAIEAGLKLKNTDIRKTGQREFSSAGELKRKEENLKKAAGFDCDELKNALNSESVLNNEEKKALENARKTFTSSQSRKVGIKRFLRRNKNRIIVVIIAALFLGWMADGFIKENRRLATSKGLDSAQTTAVLYTFIHHADVPDLQEIAKGKLTKDLILKTAGFYVTQKQREEQNNEEKTVTPAERLFYKQTSKYWMYGITGLKIDGKETAADSHYFRREEKPAKIAEENGIILKRGNTAVHTAEYYLIHQDSFCINVEKIKEDVHLEWNGNRWLVKEISGESKSMPVKAKDFFDEYYSLMESGKSIKETAEALKEKYEWLPQEDDMTTAAEKLYKNFGSIEAGKYLEK